MSRKSILLLPNWPTYVLFIANGTLVLSPPPEFTAAQI